MILGEKLKKFRRSKNSTQEEFAQILGLKRTAYAAYETGRVGVSTSMLQDLANHFEISIDQLLKDINSYTDATFKPAEKADPPPYRLSGKKAELDTLLEIVNKLSESVNSQSSALKDVAETMKSQQETIHFLTTNQGNAGGHTAAAV